MAPPKPTMPATAPTTLLGKRSVGRTITSVDQDCCPKYARLKIAMAQAMGACGDQQDKRHHCGAQAQGDFAGYVHGEFSADQIAGEPAAQQASDARGCVGDPSHGADRLDVEAARVVEIFRQPEKIEVPGGVAQEFCGHQAPGFWKRSRSSHAIFFAVAAMLDRRVREFLRALVR